MQNRLMRTWNLPAASQVLAALALVGIIGCGPSKPETHPVTGIVLFKGKPVEGATVTFSSGDSSAVGRTDAQGKYSLTTFERDDGAAAGEYKVRVLKYDTPPAPAAAGGGSDENYVPPPLEESAPPPPKSLLPEVYSSSTRTPLSFTVQPGENVFDITID